MANGYSKQIQLRTQELAEGNIFVNSDFADIADTETIRRNFNRLTQGGILRRIINGKSYLKIFPPPHSRGIFTVTQ